MNNERLHQLLGQVVQDVGAASMIPLVMIGNSLELYKTLSEKGPLTAEQFAQETKLAERYLREWLAAQAASGYISYDAQQDEFSLSEEQAAVFANEHSPVFLAPAFECSAAILGNREKVEEAFHSGEGVPWEDQSPCLSCAVAKFFRPGYENNLVSQWLPALDGMLEKLEQGIEVADIGCGHGVSTMIMAEAFPNSQFVGFDFHEQSIADANEHAKRHGLENLRYEVALAKEYPGKYGLVTIFDCLHDMGDPAGAMAHVRQSLTVDGACMIVEPLAGDVLEDNLNPVGRLYYAASTMVCVPTSLAQEVGSALGAQAGEKRLREVIVEGGGFGSFRRATETPFNLILEAKA